MNEYARQEHKSTDEGASTQTSTPTSPRAILSERLQQTDVTAERCIPLAGQTKSPKRGLTNHQDVEKHDRPEAIETGNYGVHAGRGLLVVDIDDRAAAPDWITNLPSTFKLESPHGGRHLYYVVEEDDGIQNQDFDWGEIRYEGLYVLGPGSKLDHAQCNDAKEGCPGAGYGTYNIEVDKPIATLADDDLDHIRGSAATETGDKEPTESHGTIESLDKERAERETEWLCKKFLPKRAGQAASDELMDLLKGQVDSPEWRREGGSSPIDRSKCDFHALSYLYGAFISRGDDAEEARRNALAVFRHFYNENKYNATGQLRKPLARDDGYLADTMDSVQDDFDIQHWFRWHRREHQDGFDSDDQQPWLNPAKDGKPGDIVEKTVLAAVWKLSFPVDLPVDDLAEMFAIYLRPVSPHTVNKCLPPARRQASSDADGGEHPQRRYPTAREVAELAAELNPDRSEETFRDVVRQLTRRDTGPNAGRITHAYCRYRPNRHRHVYYVKELEPPEDAEWVKVGGEEHHLKSEDGSGPD